MVALVNGAAQAAHGKGRGGMDKSTQRLSTVREDDQPAAPSSLPADEYEADEADPLVSALREQNELLKHQLAAQGKQIDNLSGAVDRLLSQVAAQQSAQQFAPPTKNEEDAEAAALVRDAKRAMNARVLAAINGEDPVADKAVENALSRVRKLLKDAGEIKALAEEASATLGGGVAAQPEPSLAEQIEAFSGAAEKAASTNIGKKLLGKILGDDKPGIESKSEDSGVTPEAAYG